LGPWWSLVPKACEEPPEGGGAERLFENSLPGPLAGDGGNCSHGCLVSTPTGPCGFARPSGHLRTFTFEGMGPDPGCRCMRRFALEREHNSFTSARCSVWRRPFASNQSSPGNQLTWKQQQILLQAAPADAVQADQPLRQGPGLPCGPFEGICRSLERQCCATQREANPQKLGEGTGSWCPRHCHGAAAAGEALAVIRWVLMAHGSHHTSRWRHLEASRPCIGCGCGRGFSSPAQRAQIRSAIWCMTARRSHAAEVPLAWMWGRLPQPRSPGDDPLGGEGQAHSHWTTQIGAGSPGRALRADEPSIRPAQRDNDPPVATLSNTSRLGNTLIVGLEHDRGPIRAA